MPDAPPCANCGNLVELQPIVVETPPARRPDTAIFCTDTCLEAWLDTWEFDTTDIQRRFPPE